MLIRFQHTNAEAYYMTNFKTRGLGLRVGKGGFMMSAQAALADDLDGTFIPENESIPFALTCEIRDMIVAALRAVEDQSCAL